MPTHTLLQLGAGELMRHSIRLIQALGYRVYAVDKNPNAPAFAVADGFAPIDLVDVDGIEAYAREIGAEAILAVNEAGVTSASIVSERLGLRYVSPQVAQRALDKGDMRLAWQAAGLSQPRFAITDDVSAIPELAQAIGYPLILKPTLNWGSRGTSRVDDAEGLAWAIEFAQENQRSGRFIVEECIDGIEMTVEGLAYNGQISILAKSDKEHQAHPRFRVAVGLNYPANFSPAVLAQADQLITDAARALGIDNAAIHCEAMLRGDRLYLIEMAARPGGGHIFGQVVEAVSGVCMPQALAKILLNEPVDIQPRYQHGAVYRFFAPPQGIFLEAQGVEEAKQMQGVLDFGFVMERGRKVGAIEGDADRPGYCVTQGDSREEAMQNATRAIQSVRFVMG